jgi:RNA polymerase sigma factor (sigma-70 family)
MNYQELPWPELLTLLRMVPPDEGAWEELYRRLERYARTVLHSTSSGNLESPEDLAQETLVKLLESTGALSRLDANQSPEGYLKVAVRNAARDLARRKVLATKALQQLAGDKRLSLRPAREDERAAALADEVNRLSAEQRQLLRWRFHEGLDIGEIARRLGESYSAVAVRLFRIVKYLKSRLGTPPPKP